MKILLAEDHEDTAVVYKAALGDKGHVVVHTTNGEDCLKVYHNEIQIATMHLNPKEHIQPFDAVLIDYNMPRMNGLELAKEILSVNPHQRIIFAYLQDILLGSIHQLNQIVEILNKPFSEQELIDTVEDKSILKDVLDILKKGKEQKEHEDNKS
jgi:CheY-like chemotaxis protein